MLRFLPCSAAVAAVLLAGCASDQLAPPPPPTVISLSSGNNQTGEVGLRLTNPLRVLVTQGGNPVSGASIAWTTTGGVVSPPAATTDANGLAAANWDLPTTAGTYTAVAAANEASNSPVTFQATAQPGPPAIVLQSEGDNQSAPVNTTLPEPLQVFVSDAFGNALEGVDVTWDITAGSATLSTNLSQTNATGIASTIVTLGPTAGQVTVEASPGVVVQGAPVVFTATATP